MLHQFSVAFLCSFCLLSACFSSLSVPQSTKGSRTMTIRCVVSEMNHAQAVSLFLFPLASSSSFKLALREACDKPEEEFTLLALSTSNSELQLPPQPTVIFQLFPDNATVSLLAYFGRYPDHDLALMEENDNDEHSEELGETTISHDVDDELSDIHMENTTIRNLFTNIRPIKSSLKLKLDDQLIAQ
eukprot:TRINITY_DN703_c0_g1_i2.p1 TRINITY_DN703_c0_g1~~TRINITY_DN703_c0_g1_i2.p1  ORF type:complete len:187 (-),score=30.34 TRINITY_DN703_c0_g1_i2:1062-1622(-)